MLRDHPSAYQALVRRSTEENEAVARGAIGGLGERKDQQARPHLESLLGHANPNIRWAAVLALDDLGAGPSEKALWECAKVETDEDVKRKIREILQ
jgi:HEAT repeat protein